MAVITDLAPRLRHLPLGRRLRPADLLSREKAGALQVHRWTLLADSDRHGLRLHTLAADVTATVFIQRADGECPASHAL